ncbi:hypothetical protein THRCLA_21643 [Thraustotheca clavata]|uniref:Uncharacterized protein n=1 Tax=Thraustotheca clavata TaxID=74557 RepID=A0A1V9ZSN5_9STRA|nr:hypothetical protein THRCLA_21643 [Thraustotheca clavata]
MLSMPFVVALLTRKYSMDSRQPSTAMPTAGQWYSKSSRYLDQDGVDLTPNDAIVLKKDYRDRSDTASTASTSASHDIFWLNKQQPSQESQEPVQERQLVSSIPEGAMWRNVFERLYQADYHQKRDERLAQERARLYAIHCTFVPAVLGPLGEQEKEATLTITARLYSPTYHQDRLARLEAAQHDEECTFQPEIIERHRPNTSVVSRLYKATYFEEREKKLIQLRVQYEVECTFMPNINKYYHPVPRKPLYDPHYVQARSSILIMMEDRHANKKPIVRRGSSTASTCSSTRRLC